MAGFLELIKAVEKDNINRVRRLVRKGTDVNCTDSWRKTVLHHAAMQGKLSMVKLLVRLGAKINAVDIYRCTPLHCACFEAANKFILKKIFRDSRLRGMSEQQKEQAMMEIVEEEKIKMVDCLISLGADVNATCEINTTSLHEAVRLRNIQGIKMLTWLGVDANVVKITGLNVFFFAIRQVHLMLMRRLVKLGAEVNSLHRQETALFDAVRSGRVDIVKALFQNGADVNAIGRVFPTLQATQLVSHAKPDQKKFVGFNMNMRIIDPQIIKCLAELGVDLDCPRYAVHVIHEVVKCRKPEILNYLVQCGADVSASKTSITALTEVVKQNDNNMIEFLVKCGASINARYDMITSPLSEAISQGDSEMVKDLVKHGATVDVDLHNIDHTMYKNSTSALLMAVQAGCINTKTIKTLLRLGGDVNAKHDQNVSALHHAVAIGDSNLLKILCHLKPNMDTTKMEGFTVVHSALRFRPGVEIDLIKALVEAGADLNAGYTEYVTPLHDAVRLSNTEMVKTLSHLGANMNSSKTVGVKPMHVVTYINRRDLIEYFAEIGTDMNVTCSEEVRPLHDAVQLGNIDMVVCLEKFGADVRACRKDGLTPMFAAVVESEPETLKCLVQLGADINVKINKNVSALHNAVQLSNTEMIHTLVRLGLDVLVRNNEMSLLQVCVNSNRMEKTECLLTMGINRDCDHSITITALEDAIRRQDIQSIEELLPLTNDMERLIIQSSDEGIKVQGNPAMESPPCELACRMGHVDLTRLLIIAGFDFNRTNRRGKTPLDYLPLAHIMDYSILHEATTSEKVIETVSGDSKCQSGLSILCPNITSLHHTMGIGDVKYIPSPTSTDVADQVHNLIQIMSSKRKHFSGAKLKRIGSAAEGTKVGLPTEMDFLLELEISTYEETKVKSAGFGYAHYVSQSEPMFREGSRSFHISFVKDTTNGMTCVRKLGQIGKVRVNHPHAETIDDENRKACSVLEVLWEDGDLMFVISVDVVPSLHVDNWPEMGTRTTWLMDYETLKSRGYILVPKPPHVKSALAKKYTKEKLDSLWRISFAHLETEHMQRLEKRVKDVYLTAKSLRNPDVCRIMITDQESWPNMPKPVDKYITSYLLKMMFFKNVQYFLSSHLSLGAMVRKVYDDLDNGLSYGFIPLFFMPAVNALDGIKLNVPKCAKVGKIMKRFVRALYLRDCHGGATDLDVDQEIIVYQRKPKAVYHAFEIGY